MKVGIITKANEKGQIVIPKEARDALGLGPDSKLHVVVRGRGIYIHPIKDVIHESETESSYIKILEDTKGKWASEDWSKVRNNRKNTELKASKRRKQDW